MLSAVVEPSGIVMAASEATNVEDDMIVTVLCVICRPFLTPIFLRYQHSRIEITKDVARSNHCTKRKDPKNVVSRNRINMVGVETFFHPAETGEGML